METIPTIFNLEARIASCNNVVIGSHHSNCPFKNGVNAPYCAKIKDSQVSMMAYQENKLELTASCPLVQDVNDKNIMKGGD